MALSVVGMEDRRWQVSPCVICLYLSRPPHPPQPLCSLVPLISAAAARPSFPSVLTHPTPTGRGSEVRSSNARGLDRNRIQLVPRRLSTSGLPRRSPRPISARVRGGGDAVRACHDRRADLSKRSGHRQHTLGRPGWLAGRRRGIEQSDGNGVTPPSLLALCTVNLSAPAPAPASDIRHPSDVCLPYLNACMIRVRAVRGCGSVCGVHGYGFLCTASLRYMRHAPCMRTKHVCTSRWCQRHGGRFL